MTDFQGRRFSTCLAPSFP